MYACSLAASGGVRGTARKGNDLFLQITLAENADARIARDHSLTEGHRETIPTRDYIVERVKLFPHHIAGGAYPSFAFLSSLLGSPYHRCYHAVADLSRSPQTGRRKMDDERKKAA